jgi:transposase
MLLPIALALGGEAAARLLPTLGLAASPSTLLRLIRKSPEPEMATPRVLGVDDWALRRGSVFGTILVDLEKHKVIDLLPDRTVESLAEWLRQHPGVEIVSRDRSGAYAQAITQGAPDAIQVADRWHLLKNNLETLERVLQREPHAMTEAASPLPTPLPDQQADAPTPQESPRPAPAFEEGTTANDNEPTGDSKPREPTARAKRIYEQIQALAKEGLSVYQIHQQAGFAYETIYKYLGAKSCPVRARHRTKISAQGEFEQHLRRRWQEGCTNAKALWKELRAMGFTGSLSSVQRHVAGWPTAQALVLGQAALRPPAPPSARQARWWLILPSERLTTEQAAYVARLIEVSPEVRKAQQLAVEFRRLICERDEPALDPWLRSAEESGLQAFRSFVTGLREDLAAVRAALVLPWSNGQTEGQVNKLKLVKRQGYGRANVPLLRKRLVA